MSDIENMCVDFIDEETQSEDDILNMNQDDKPDSETSSHLDSKININLKSLNNSPIKSLEINDIKSTFQTSKNIDLNSMKFDNLILRNETIIEDDQESIDYNNHKE